MDNGDKVIVCDQCKHEFLIGSVGIKECSVEIEGKELLLDYFMCPSCKTVYKVLFVEEQEYRRLVDDLVSTQHRIQKMYGKQKTMQNVQLIKNLQSMANRKSERLKKYVEGMNAKYSGSFTYIATENNNEDGTIIYRP